MFSTQAQSEYDQPVDIVVSGADGRVVHMQRGVEGGDTIVVTRYMLVNASFSGLMIVSMLDPRAGNAAASIITTDGAPAHCYGLACTVIDVSCGSPLRVGDEFGFISVAGFAMTGAAYTNLCSCKTSPSAGALECSAQGDPEDCSFIVGAVGCTDVVSTNCPHACGVCSESEAGDSQTTTTTTTTTTTGAAVTEGSTYAHETSSTTMTTTNAERASMIQCADGVVDPPECTLVVGIIGCVELTNRSCPIACNTCERPASSSSAPTATSAVSTTTPFITTSTTPSLDESEASGSSQSSKLSTWVLDLLMCVCVFVCVCVCVCVCPTVCV